MPFLSIVSWQNGFHAGVLGTVVGDKFFDNFFMVFRLKINAIFKYINYIFKTNYNSNWLDFFCSLRHCEQKDELFSLDNQDCGF